MSASFKLLKRPFKGAQSLWKIVHSAKRSAIVREGALTRTLLSYPGRKT
jgi:hypothetical protein